MFSRDRSRTDNREKFVAFSPAGWQDRGVMNETSNIEVLDDDSVKEADATLERPAMPSSLPPVTPPPPHMVTRPMQTIPPPPALGELTTRFVPDSVPPLRRPSRWRSIVAAVRAGGLSRARIGVACAVVGLGIVVTALVVGLASAAPEAHVSATVAAAMVIGRALVAVGAMGVGYALLRMAERLLSARAGTAKTADARLDLN
jgi:hypothetical protein